MRVPWLESSHSFDLLFREHYPNHAEGYAFA